MDEDDSEHHRSMAATLAAPTNSDMSVLNDGVSLHILQVSMCTVSFSLSWTCNRCADNCIHQ